MVKITHLDHTNSGKLILTNKDLADQDTLREDATYNVLLNTALSFLEAEFVKRGMVQGDMSNILSQILLGTQQNAIQYLLERDATSIKNGILHYQLAVAEEEVKHAEQKTQLNDLAIKEGEQRLELNLVNIELAKKELDLKEAQIELTKAQVEIAKLELELKATELEIKKQELQIQLEIAMLNKELIAQKVITEKAQTNTNDKDGNPYTGLIGAQIQLVKEQRESFIKDAEAKLVKMYVDAYASRKAIDEGTETPSSLDTKATNAVLKKATTTLGIDIGTV